MKRISGVNRKALISDFPSQDDFQGFSDGEDEVVAGREDIMCTTAWDGCSERTYIKPINGNRKTANGHVEDPFKRVERL